MKRIISFFALLVVVLTTAATPLSNSGKVNGTSCASADEYQYVKTVKGWAHGYYGGSGERDIEVYVENSIGKYVVVKYHYLYPQKNEYKEAGNRNVSNYQYMVSLPNTQWTYFFNLTSTDEYRYVKTVKGWAHGYYGGSEERDIDVYVENSTGKYVVMKNRYLYPQKNEYLKSATKFFSVPILAHMFC